MWHETARWIWGGDVESPRNAWRLFRKSFQAHDRVDQVWLDMTADSRYLVYINGKSIGWGPNRSWQEELSYDTYDLSSYILPGEENTIAVMVLHFGVTNFYYLKGRGGLLAQLRFLDDAGEELETIVTNKQWVTLAHPGQDTRAPRMSCQQAFAERIDARLLDDAWKARNYDDQHWLLARELGPVGMKPWSSLVPRDIPPLTEETIYPIRVESLKRVERVSWNAYIDVRSQMVPDSIEHANLLGFVGYLATVIRCSAEASMTLGFPTAHINVGAVVLNGQAIPKERFYGEQPERYVELKLGAGDHLLLVDITGIDHGHGFRIGVHSVTPFEVVSPLKSEEAQHHSPFVSIGPFDYAEMIDHQPARLLNKEHPAYLSVPQTQSAEDLEAYAAYMSAVPYSLYRDDDVLGHCIWKSESAAQAIPHSLQHAVTADAQPGKVPLYPGADTEMIIDFGKETVGFIEFEVAGAAGTIIDFYGFEYMRDEYMQHMYGLDNTLRYILREGRQVYRSPIRRGFRYLMVTVRQAAKPVSIYGVRAVQSTYPVAEIGRFHCSDALLNDIWQISRDTTKLCMEDTFVDCPTFEQVFWVGDSRNEALVGNYIFSVPALTERCLRLVPGSRFQTPLYSNQVPSGWSSVIPNWTFFWIIACNEHYLQTGRVEFASEIWPLVRYTLEHYMQHINDQGLFEIRAWNLLDWAPIDQPNEGIVTHQNMFLAKALCQAAQLAVAAGDALEANALTQQADQLKSAINQHLWTDEHHAYIDCIHADGRRSTSLSMQTQVIAYLCDIAEGQRNDTMKQYLQQPPAPFVQIGSPFMSFFYYEALAKLGQITTIVEDIRRNYGKMIEYEASTCWEMYPNYSENRFNPNLLTRSHCHAWSAAPGYFLGAYVLGVRPISAGWERVAVEPNPCGLSWARGSVPLPEAGRVDVAWRADESERRLDIEVRVPAGQQVEVRLPAGYIGEVKVFDL